MNELIKLKVEVTELRDLLNYAIHHYNSDNKSVIDSIVERLEKIDNYLNI